MKSNLDPAQLAKERGPKFVKNLASGGREPEILDELAEDLADDPNFPKRSDTGNAELFAREHGANLRFNHETGEWWVFDGRRWGADRTGEPYRLAEATVRTLYALATNPQHPDRKEAAKWAARSDDVRRIGAMLTLARSRLPVVSEMFDRPWWALNVENGTVDLRTGFLQPHRRDDFLSKLAPVYFDSDAPAERWEMFLSEIMGGDRELVDFLQVLVGYSACGNCTEAVVPILLGTGENGKSVFRETLAEMLGDYAQALCAETLLEQKTTQAGGARADLVRLNNARLVFSSELPLGRNLAEERVKSFSGGDTLVVRGLYERREAELVPTWTIWLIGNHKPKIVGTDRGIWRRLALIPFSVTFPPGDPRRDPNLREKLRAEASGILAWVVRGALRWQAEGLHLPDKVRAATAEYRSAEDAFASFLTDRCEEGEEFWVTAARLLASYNEWAKANGEREMTGRALGIQLSDRGFVQHRSATAREWYGLKLMTQ